MDFNKYAKKGNQIVDELGVEIGFPENRKLSGRLLRSVLHVLRRRLSVDESFHFMAQLPVVLKGVYVEGWKIHDKPKKIKNKGDFIREVIHEDFPVGHHDIQSVKDGENVIRAVFKVLRRHISEGEVNNILAVMPKKIKPLWESDLRVQPTYGQPEI